MKSPGFIRNSDLNHCNKKAGDGNRTHVSSLEGWCSTIELHPHVVGVTGFEPATSWSQTRRSSQAEPHPDMNFYPEKQVIQVLVFSVSSVTQELLYKSTKKMTTLFLHFFQLFSNCPNPMIFQGFAPINTQFQTLLLPFYQDP